MILSIISDRNKISGYCKANITVTSDVKLLAYECRTTLSGEAWGRGTGIDLLSDNGAASDGTVTFSEPSFSFSFDVEANELSCDGDYRISIYVKDANGVWNDTCRLLTKDGETVYDKNGWCVLMRRTCAGTDDSFTSVYTGAEIDAFCYSVLKI